MKYVLLTFSILFFSPNAFCNTDALTTVFSWLDDDGVMHYADEKPKEVSLELITKSEVAEPSILGTPIIEVQDIAESDIPLVESLVAQTTDDKSTLIALNEEEEELEEGSNQIASITASDEGATKDEKLQE